MAKKDKSDIYVNAQSLFYRLYEAQFNMPKRDRPVLAVRLLDHTERLISNFEMAYVSDDKLKHIERMIAEFSILKVLIRFADDNHKFAKESIANELRELVIKIDESVVKWRNYVVSARQEQCSERH